MPARGDKPKGKGKAADIPLQPSEAQEVPNLSAYSTESTDIIRQQVYGTLDHTFSRLAISDHISQYKQTDTRVEGSQQLGMDYPTQHEIGGSEISPVNLGDHHGKILAVGFKESREYEIDEVMQGYEHELLDPRIAGRAFMAEELNPDIKGNCHGFSLTGRRDLTIDESSFPSLESANVHPIQAVIDHFQFKPVAAEKSTNHDLVVYYNDANEIIHSGRVFIDQKTKKPMVESLPGEAPFTYHDFDAVFSDYRCSNGEPLFVVWHTDDPSNGYITAT